MRTPPFGGIDLEDHSADQEPASLIALIHRQLAGQEQIAARVGQDAEGDFRSIEGFGLERFHACSIDPTAPECNLGNL